MPETILVVEDEPALRETLAYNLERQGYAVLTAADGRTAVELALEREPDALVLDVMLPEMDGFEVCRVVRQELSVPILMLTARDDEIDKVVGLEVGADDYLTKPFSMRELMARVKAMLRRVRLTRDEALEERAALDEGRTAPSTPEEAEDDGHERLVFGDLVIDVSRREILLDGEPLHLKPKEYALLEFLARNRRMVLSRDTILEKVWGWDFGGGTRTVDVHIRWLRRKIERDPSSPTRIITIRGVGYRFDG